MKFAEHLIAHITPEWRKQYIHYEEMKEMLYRAVEEAPSAESVDPDQVTRHYLTFDEQFFQYVEKELKKINTFYSEKLAEATRKFATLNSELSATLNDSKFKHKTKFHERNVEKTVIPYRKLQEFKTAFSEFYLSLILLQNYQSLNHTGFRKILKKHDKLFSVDVGGKWHLENVETAHFFTNKDIDKLISETENTFISHLESGDRQKAMKKLRVPPLGDQRSPWTTFKVGLFSGAFICLMIAVILSTSFHENSSQNVIAAAQLYRGPLLIIVFIFLMGINVYGWRSSGVNHVLIFELDPRNHLSEQDLMEFATIFGVVWSLSVLSFLYSESLSIPPFLNPIVLVAIMIVFLLNPLNIFHHDARYWFLRIFGRLCLAPFLFVQFADFWLADQLNSLVTLFVDIYFFMWFYIINGFMMETQSEYTTDIWSPTHNIVRGVISCFPAMVRFWQCLRRYRDTKEAFPHIANAGKYSTTFFVVIFSTCTSHYKSYYEERDKDNPFFFLWIAAAIINSFYGYIWDVKIDWGLFDKSAGENKYLREEIVYTPGFYYIAIIVDLFLRFMWALSMYLTETSLLHPVLLSYMTAFLEVFRRFLWNFFRLENEHLNNCGKFRAVRDISVAPIDQSDQLQMIRMMDEDDGVVNRKHRKREKKVEDKQPLLSSENILKIKPSLML